LAIQAVAGIDRLRLLGDLVANFPALATACLWELHGPSKCQQLLVHYIGSDSRQARNIENEKRAIEIRIRAERQCGELFVGQEKARPPGTNQHQLRSHSVIDPPTLQELGISKTQSSRWQKLAGIPEEEFEATFRQPDKPSTSGILAAGDHAKRTKRNR
jgi:hypothetical protein